MSQKGSSLGLGRAYRMSMDELYDEAEMLLGNDRLKNVRYTPGNESIDMRVVLYGDLSIPFAEQTIGDVLNYVDTEGGFTLLEGD